MKKIINVNELNNILSEHFQKEIFIEKIRFASAINQYHPKKSEIGIGGQLNITMEMDDKN